MQSSDQWIRLAQILRPQGRKGEVLAELYTEQTEYFDANATVALAPSGFAEGVSTGSPGSAEVVGYWLPVGRNAGRIVLQFAGVSSIEAAEALAGKEVVIPAADRLPLTDGSVYVSDLVGAMVFDGELHVGEIEEVLFPATPDGARRLDEAVPLLKVTSPGGDEVLIPFASAYLVEVDLSHRTVRMQLPAGLLELNRGSSVTREDASGEHAAES